MSDIDLQELGITEIFSREEAMEAWDGESLLIRPERDETGTVVHVYVYPQLGAGYAYPRFDLRREACLQPFHNVETAIMWVRGQGKNYNVVE